ncbi:MAG: DUF5777 family beta-barrel protein [Bacteroidales bacterium]|jgi:opacity protein-like surface antigen|nr:DUF5777 family beta-barrel protein [Bacteroidales bacterium]
MKKYTFKFFITLLIAATSTIAFAQEETEEKVEKPVRTPWEASTLIENQTIIGSYAKSLELIIHHRFGGMDNGFTDLFGIYAASNIRMGLQYGITDKLTVGIGTEKANKYQDVNAKYAILTQTRSGSMPIALSVYASVTLDSREDQFFGDNYAFTDRFSYFTQVIVARKFTDALSVQIAPSYSHFNSVDSVFQNNKGGVMIGGRYKFTGTMSAMFEYHQPININTPRDYATDIQPGLAFGLEISTPTHAFQVFATNYQGIMAQKNYIMNTNKIDGEGLLLGFNIIVRFQ